MASGSLFGLLSERELPDASFDDAWHRIVVAGELKERMLNYLTFTLAGRDPTSKVALPVHGLLLLKGPPGTGKTTLAHGLANQVARRLYDRDGVQTHFAEFDCHGIGSGVLGETPKHVDRIFVKSIPDLARDHRPTVVLLDEVENVAVARRQASLEANPMDVHRATNALLTGLDTIRDDYPNVVFVATSNFPEAIDEAFLSRVDVALDVPLPGGEAVASILHDTMTELSNGELVDDPPGELVERLTGWDARQIRKLVLQAIIANVKTAEEPSLLSWGAVLEEARRGLAETSVGTG